MNGIRLILLGVVIIAMVGAQTVKIEKGWLHLDIETGDEN